MVQNKFEHMPMLLQASVIIQILLEFEDLKVEYVRVSAKTNSGTFEGHFRDTLTQPFYVRERVVTLHRVQPH